MRAFFTKLFIYSASVLLLFTAAAKLISGFGSVRILQLSDPVFGIQFRYLFWIVGGIEAAVAVVCLFGKQAKAKVALIAWLATCFIIYRLGLNWVGYYKPCNCLGNLTDMLHISPQTADAAMKIVLGYLLVGSYATLFWLWKEKREASLAAQSSAKATGSAS
jgi:hypothetical protein